MIVEWDGQDSTLSCSVTSAKIIGWAARPVHSLSCRASAVASGKSGASFRISICEEVGTDTKKCDKREPHLDVTASLERPRVDVFLNPPGLLNAVAE